MRSIGAFAKNQQILWKALYAMTNTIHSRWKMPFYCIFKIVHAYTLTVISFVCKRIRNKIKSSVFKCYAFINAALAHMPFNI